MISKDINVVIVGGGPIGLAHAWGIKKLNPHIQVTVFEKYKTYQRNHTLILKVKPLEDLMKTTGTLDNPHLKALLIKIKNDPHILTNELEEIFKKVIAESNVKMNYQAVEKNRIDEQLLSLNPHLIIGADGTHSVVSSALFPDGNQIKHEVAFALQLRYEIDGDQKAEATNTIKFFQHMVRQGLIANEVIGRYDETTKKTPVSLQMIISKQAFEQLKAIATSKNPIKPYQTESKHHDAEKIRLSQHDIELPFQQVPAKIRHFLTGYLALKIKSCHKKHIFIDPQSLRVSVNESPATHAKQIIHLYKEVPMILVGDAGLGLSFFKGLNAGLESTNTLLSLLSPMIKNNDILNKELITQRFLAYQDWFLNNFAPQKVKAVEEYSKKKIAPYLFTAQAISKVKTLSMREYEEDCSHILEDYFNLLAQDPLIKDRQQDWVFYPHRGYDPVNLSQLHYVPISHTLNKTAKLFVDYTKPYKFYAQLKQDYKQPFAGGVNMGAGVINIVTGIATLSPKRMGDGFFRLIRGTQVALPINMPSSPTRDSLA